LKTVVVGLPRGLSFSSKAKKLAKGIVVKGASGKRVKFTARVSHGELTVKLAKGQTKMSVAISDADLSESKSLENQVKHKRTRSLSVLVQATNAANTTTGVVAKLKV
ncbi:MAG TPA: hypothetical protein VG186_19015, partial [Solirubrobacteraceae bacterium]|nr:hypothetical protein [Solirubrobacteraceae bacterium]